MILQEVPFGVSVLNAAVTAAGTTQATATPLNALTSIVTTVPANSGVTVIRPAKVWQVILNAGANPLNVYPLIGMALFPAATNTPIVLQPGRSLGLIVADDTVGYIIFNTTTFG